MSFLISAPIKNHQNENEEIALDHFHWNYIFILRILPGENGNDLCIIQSTEDFDSHVGVETRCHEKLFFVASGNAPG